MSERLIVASVIVLLLVGCASNKVTYEPKRTFGPCSTLHNCASTIRNAIMDNWSRPPSARNGMVVVLRLVMERDGRTTLIEVLESSGDRNFDRSAINAVENASPFLELADIDADTYEQNFRVLKLRFEPVDLER